MCRYDQAENSIGHSINVLVTGLVFMLFCVILKAFPGSPAEQWGVAIQFFWNDMQASYSEHTLFVVVSFLLFFCTYWAISLAYLLLDIFRPASLLPYKIQTSYILSKHDLLRAIILVLANHSLAFPVIYGSSFF